MLQLVLCFSHCSTSEAPNVWFLFLVMLRLIKGLGGDRQITILQLLTTIKGIILWWLLHNSIISLEVATDLLTRLLAGIPL